ARAIEQICPRERAALAAADGIPEAAVATAIRWPPHGDPSAALRPTQAFYPLLTRRCPPLYELGHTALRQFRYDRARLTRHVANPRILLAIAPGNPRQGRPRQEGRR